MYVFMYVCTYMCVYICIGYKARDETFSVRSTLEHVYPLGCEWDAFFNENVETLPYNLFISHPTASLCKQAFCVLLYVGLYIT